MRRSMDFGPLGDVEPLIQNQGLSLAPMSTGDASLSVAGVTVLATARGADIASGALKGLVVPGGMTDDASMAAVKLLLDAAQAKGVPILAFGDGVAQAVVAAGGNPADFSEAPAVLIHGTEVTSLADRDAVATAAGKIG
tara:strand:- start:12724 stop:13140 length:417 start_codon:yes stop_codon:yes gene_type:complete